MLTRRRRWTVVPLLLLTVGLAVACSDDDQGLDADPTPEEIADVIGCTDRADHVRDPGEPVEPAGSLSCVLGESAIGIQTYDGSDEVTTVLDHLDRFTGFRVADERWIVAVDTPEAAEEVAELTGGRLIRLRGGDDVE